MTTLNYATPVARPSRLLPGIGWALSALAILGLGFSAYMKFKMPPDAVQGFEHLGYPMRLAVALGILEVSCALIYAIPQTAVLGAVLLTAYLGGATATHVRIGESFAAPVILGVIVWVGILLRERRLWALMPFRRQGA